jgi:hypothetical protein
MPNQAAWWCSALLIFSLDRQDLIVRGLFRIEGSKGCDDAGLSTLAVQNLALGSRKSAISYPCFFKTLSTNIAAKDSQPC